jgi:hypothetical protein
VAACSSATIGVFLGGYDASARSNVIDYVTIATPGSATDFGDLDAGIQTGAATSDMSRGVYVGGKDATGNRSNRIQYFAIDTPGNAADFGDLTDDPELTAAASGN